MTQPRQQPDFASLVRGFFCDRLVNQQNVSPHTVAAYRDTFRLLLAFVSQRRRKTPSGLTLEDMDAPTVLAFLDDLEKGRGNSIRTRNARLTAIRAFVTYACARDPAALPLAQRVLAIPRKRFDRPLLGYLSREEVAAVLDAPVRADWSGRRDRALFTLMYNTGARVSEAIGLRRCLPGAEFVSMHSREGAEAALCAVVEGDGGVAEGLAGGNRPRGPGASVPQSARPADVPFGCRGPLAAGGVRGSGPLPFSAGKGSVTAHATSHNSHAPAAVGSGRYPDRAVVGTREFGIDTPVRRGRRGDEASRTGESGRTTHRARPAEEGGWLAGLPGRPVKDYAELWATPTFGTPVEMPTTPHSAGLGIAPAMPSWA
jgi:integrase family protein with SAM-like domain